MNRPTSTSRRTCTVLGALVVFTACFLAACGSGNSAIGSTSTTLGSVVLAPLPGSDASGIAGAMQSLLASPTWNGHLTLIPRGVTPGTINTAANQTINSPDAVQVLEQDGYKKSSTSTFGVSDLHNAIVGDAGFSVYQFGSADGAMSFYSQWQGNSKTQAFPGIANSNYSATLKDDCASGDPECFIGGFVMKKNAIVVDAGFDCSTNCKDMVLALGPALYRAMG
jgi:hypothetical protein